MKRRALLLALLLLASTGCSDLLGVFGGGPDLSLALFAPEGAGAALHLTVVVDGERFRLDGPGRRTVRAPGTGELPVRVVLAEAGGGALASAAFTQRFQDGSDHWVHAEVGARRPVGHCIGRLRIVPLRPARPDTLFLLHGALPQDAIC